MPRPHHLCLALLVGLSAIATPSAQERLFTFVPGVTVAPGVLAEIGTAPGELGTLKAIARAPIDFEVTSASPVAGGRFIAATRYVRNGFPGSTELYVFDLRSGAVVDTGARFLPGTITASDPRVPRVVVRHLTPSGDYGLSTVDLVRFDVTGLSYSLPSSASILETLFTYTSAGAQLIVGTSTGVDVVDLATGHRTRTIAGSGSPLAADPAGTVYLVRADSASGGVRVHAVDPVTGAVGASSGPIPHGAAFHIVVDGPRRRLLLLPVCDRCGAAPPIGVLNADTLAFEGAVAQASIADVGPAIPGQSGDTWLHASARNDAYFVWQSRFLAGSPGGGPQFRCLHYTLTRVNAKTGAVSERADMRSLGVALFGPGGECRSGGLLQLNAPSPPTLTADVAGSAVTMTWSDPGNTTHFDVEVGSAPGVRNLLVLSRVGSTFRADAVPPGTYYLRIRAINEIGRSLPSNEVRVVVP